MIECVWCLGSQTIPIAMCDVGIQCDLLSTIPTSTRPDISTEASESDSDEEINSNDSDDEYCESDNDTEERSNMKDAGLGGNFKYIL